MTEQIIAAFGGDPAKVTIGGQSAGGGACAALLGVPSARGLFRGAVCMSGALLGQTPAGVREAAERMAVHLALPRLDRAALEELSSAEILAAADAVQREQVPRRQRAGEQGADEQGADEQGAGEPRRRRTAAAAWVYDFRWAAPGGPLRGMAFHCLDVPFVFGTAGEPGVAEAAGGPVPDGLAAQVHESLVRFVADGDPGWPRYDGGDRAVMAFGEPSSVLHDPLRTERLAWLGGSDGHG